ncbi:MAG: tetratricopeptide repeat protein [Pseudomonadota bacterium]
MLRKSASLVILFLACLFLAAPAGAAAPVNEIMAGNRAAEKGDLDRAIKHFTAAIESGKLSKENQAIAYNNRGSALDDKRQVDKAIADYSKAIAINPRYDAAYYNRSYAYERKGKLAEALQDMERAVQLEPDDGDFQQRLTYLKSKLAGTAN